MVVSFDDIAILKTDSARKQLRRELIQ